MSCPLAFPPAACSSTCARSRWTRQPAARQSSSECFAAPAAAPAVAPPRPARAPAAVAASGGDGGGGGVAAAAARSALFGGEGHGRDRPLVEDDMLEQSLDNSMDLRM
eukprot:Transcript_16837.p3 GENE.Transcript_16837~~Transcript_16837.p3  ORF type:complete len:108 (-),score=12.28 Transcript_16837:290-613(-)